MRPKLHLPVLGRALRVTGIMACFVILKAVLCHIRVRVDLFERSSIQKKREMIRQGSRAWCFLVVAVCATYYQKLSQLSARGGFFE